MIEIPKVPVPRVKPPKDLPIRDTIPQGVKEHYFTYKQAPNLLEYDAIGFDLDHCLVKYNVDALTALLIEGHLDELHQFKGYPVEITHFKYDTINLATKSTVWDIKTGAVLRLTEGAEITHAVLGYHVLQREQINKIWGSPPIYSALEWPGSCITIADEDNPYWVLLSYSNAYLVPLICHIVHLINNKTVRDKSF
jgi:hypothetical protein